MVSPSGEKTALSTQVKLDHYAASFTPTKEGGYFVILESTNLGVMEPGKKFAFVPVFYASNLVIVGQLDSKTKLTNVLDYIPMSVYANIKKGRKDNSLNYSFKNKAKTEFMATVITPEGQKLQFNGNTSSFNLSKYGKGTYTAQMMIADKTKGSKNGKEYNTIYYIATSRFIVE